MNPNAIKQKKSSKTWLPAAHQFLAQSSRKNSLTSKALPYPTNGGLYCYAGNNPVRYVDPDGREIENVDNKLLMQSADSTTLGNGPELIKDAGCVLTAYTKIANAISGIEYSLSYANETALDLGLYDENNCLSPENGEALINTLIKGSGHSIVYAGTIPTENLRTYGSCLNELERSPSKVFVTARLKTTDSTGVKTYDHTVNINKGSVIGGNILDIENSLDVKVNDTSGIRQKILNDSRKNELIRSDYFRLIK